MIKVLHIISSFNRGGRERQLAVILANSKGYIENKTVVFNKTETGYESEYDFGNGLIFLNSKNPGKRFVEMQQILKSENPQVIWTWGVLEATFGLLLSMLTPVVHINGSIRHGIRLFNTHQIWRLIVIQISRNIVANSKAGLKANNVRGGHVLYNGLDDKFFLGIDKQQYLKDNPEIKTKIKGKFVFISVANLVPYKDYNTILDALVRLKKDGIEFSYIIVGDGPNRFAIETYIGEMGLTDDVIILGQRTDVKELLSLGHIFLHSSKGEGCSNAILEAMAAGLPVIATDTGGTGEIVDLTFGRLFTYKNTSELYRHMVWFVSDNSNCEKMSQKAIQVARNRFSVDRMIADYEEIVQEVIKRKD